MAPKSLITTMLAIGLIAPNVTYAFSITEIIENAKAGNGIYVESHSSASTGGQTVTGGRTVTTGDSSASSHTETIINAGNNGGTVQVKVETSKDGEVTTKEYSQTIEGSEGAKVEVHATSAKEQSTSIKVNDEEVVPETKTVAVETFDESEAQEAQVATALTSSSKITTLFSVTIPNVIKKVFSFLWFV